MKKFQQPVRKSYKTKPLNNVLTSVPVNYRSQAIHLGVFVKPLEEFNR